MKVFDVERVVNVSQRLLVEAPSRRSSFSGDLDTARHQSREWHRVRRVPVVSSERRSPRIPFFSFPIRRQAPSFLVAYKAVRVKIPCDVDVYNVGGEAVGAVAHDIRHASFLLHQALLYPSRDPRNARFGIDRREGS